MDTLPFATTKPGPAPVPAWDRLDNRGSSRPQPVPEQKARPYQMLMMKGLQLRAYDTDVELDAAMERERQAGRHAMSFYYAPELERYIASARTFE